MWYDCNDDDIEVVVDDESEGDFDGGSMTVAAVVECVDTNPSSIVGG